MGIARTYLNHRDDYERRDRGGLVLIIGRMRQQLESVPEGLDGCEVGGGRIACY